MDFLLGWGQTGNLEVNSNSVNVEEQYSLIFLDLQNHSFHSGFECSSDAIFEKKSVIFSVLFVL